MSLWARPDGNGVTPAARAEVQRILDREARLKLASRLEGDSIIATTRSDEGASEDGLDDPATSLETQALPIFSSVENDGRSVDVL